jgi:hypothetical protein
MMRLNASKFALLYVSGIALLSSTFAYAELGGDLTSVQKDSTVMGATTTVSEHSDYKRHELNKGTYRVHEFSDANGKVFGVAWSGKKHPDLKTLLGSHFKDFQTALGQARQSHRHGGTVVVNSGNLHVELGGHMMSVHGQVWLSDQVPTGMNLHEIQ